MKKLFSIGVLTLVMITSCQNTNDEITPQPESKTQLSNTLDSKTTVTGPSDQGVINSLSDFMEANRLPGGGAIINCHTPYNTSSGHACVSSGGYMFNVMWQGTYVNVGPGDWEYVIKYYASDPVSSCGC